MKDIHLKRRYFGYDYLHPSTCHMFIADDADVELVKEQFRGLCRSQMQEISQEIRLQVVAYVDVFSDLRGMYYLTHVDGTEMMLRLHVIPNKDTVYKHYVGQIAFEALIAEDAKAMSHALFKMIPKTECLERYGDKITHSSRAE